MPYLFIVILTCSANNCQCETCEGAPAPLHTIHTITSHLHTGTVTMDGRHQTGTLTFSVWWRISITIYMMTTQWAPAGRNFNAQFSQSLSFLFPVRCLVSRVGNISQWIRSAVSCLTPNCTSWRRQISVMTGLLMFDSYILLQGVTDCQHKLFICS